MNKSEVAIIRCDTYDDDEVFSAVKKGVGLLGGAGQFAAAGQKLLLKPNVLSGAPFEKCVCTHPAVVKAVGRLFQSVTPTQKTPFMISVTIAVFPQFTMLFHPFYR